MKFLHLRIKFVIFTSRATIHMFYKQTHWIKVNGDNYNYADTNDILSVAFCCSYIKERSVMGYLFWDRLHAPSPSNRLNRLNKITTKSKIELSAYYYYYYYYYGTVSFQLKDKWYFCILKLK
jgi:hypothetical protein